MPVRTASRPAGTSIFTTMWELASRHGAINLAQGQPDFDPPSELVEAAVDAMRSGFNQYAPSIGLPGLRQAIAEHARDQYGLHHDPDSEVTVTVGATEGIWSAITALVEPDDEVILVEPYYEQYPAPIRAAGGVPRSVPVTPFPECRIDLDRLRSAFNRRTRLVVLNTPHNPTGHVLRPEELRAIGELAEEHDALILADEAYEHLAYTASGHVPVASEPRCRRRTITVGSISKTFNATGWRIGWVLAPEDITRAIRAIHQHVTWSPATALQAGAAAMFGRAGSNGYYDRLRSEFDERRRTLASYLERTPLRLSEPEGAYFLMTRCDGDDVQYCQDLITRAGVAAIPASQFFENPAGGRGLVRFVFCKRLETLHAAGERLISALR
jgi:N-succinyldiaminopimelate aminotransferase